MSMLVLPALTLEVCAAQNAGDARPAGGLLLDHLSDAQLVAHAAIGDGRAFGTLYRRHRGALLARLLGILRERAAAEDACHDAFVRAYRHLDELRGDFAPWVMRIACNLALNELRQRATRGRLQNAIDPPQLIAPPEEAAAAQAEGERTLALLAALAPAQRRVVAMRYLDGLSRAEIAERTGLDREQVRSLLQNGRRNLRLAIERAEAAKVAR